VPVSGGKKVSIEVTRVGGAIDWARVTQMARTGGVRSGKQGVVGGWWRGCIQRVA
jgi:hypothetical protein